MLQDVLHRRFSIFRFVKASHLQHVKKGVLKEWHQQCADNGQMPADDCVMRIPQVIHHSTHHLEMTKIGAQVLRDVTAARMAQAFRIWSVVNRRARMKEMNRAVGTALTPAEECTDEFFRVESGSHKY